MECCWHGSTSRSRQLVCLTQWSGSCLRRRRVLGSEDKRRRWCLVEAFAGVCNTAAGLQCNRLLSSTVLSLSFTAASALNNGNQDLTRHVLARRTGCKPGLAAWTAHDGSMDLAIILTSKSCFQRPQEQSLVGCAVCAGHDQLLAAARLVMIAGSCREKWCGGCNWPL